MDVEMPRMDGISAVREIMAASPTPILMVSSLTTSGSRMTMEALQAGALDDPDARGRFLALIDREGRPLSSPSWRTRRMVAALRGASLRVIHEAFHSRPAAAAAGSGPR